MAMVGFLVTMNNNINVPFENIKYVEQNYSH